MGLGRAFKRFFVWIGVLVDNATDTDAINMANVEAGIRTSKQKADDAHRANGKLAGQIALLKEQIARQEREKENLEGLVLAAANQNDETNGAVYAEQLASLETDLGENKAQLQNLETWYEQNTQAIAESIRQIRSFQQEFERTKVRVALSRSQEGLAEMMKANITELQGMVGGEMGQSMQKLREAAAAGQGQMKATIDLAKEMGASVRLQQEARKTRGLALFREKQAQLAAKKAETAGTAVTPQIKAAVQATAQVQAAQ